MKTTFRFTLIFCLAASLFAFPSNALADDGPPDNPPPDGFQMVDGVPVAPAGDEQPAGDAPQAASPNTYYKTLAGLDFHPIDSDMTYSSTNGGLYALALVPDFGYSATYNLPTGASVTGITFFVYDNTTVPNIELGAYRYNPATNTSDPLSTTTTAGASPLIQSVSLSGGLPFTITNSTYAYRLRVEFNSTGSTQILYGARITYTLPPVPTSTEYVTMAGADFRSSSSIMTYAAMGGTLYATAIDFSHYFQTRLDLPQGATIDQVQWFVIDNHEEYFNLRLFSHWPENDNFAIALSSSTSGSSPSPNIQVITKAASITIDNNNQSYFIGFSPLAASSTLRIVGARVRYTLPSTPDLQVKTFSGVHFYPSGSDLTYKALGAKLYALNLSSGRSFQVSLNLPSGVRIDTITFYFIDNSGQDISFAGRYYYPQTGSYSDKVTGSSDGASSSNRTVTYSNLGAVMGVMDTYDMVSRLRVELGAEGQDMYLIGAKVEYSYPKVYLPLVNR